MKFIFILLSFVYLSSQYSNAQTIYVANNGNDSNPGTLNLPYKTIQVAINKLKAGETCEIRGGVYYETLKLNSSGEVAKPITIKNYNNEKVEIHNTVLLNNWSTDVNNIFKTNISDNDTVLQLFINGKPYMQASFPSINEGEMSTNSWGNATAFSNKTITISGLSQFKNLTGAKVFGLHGDKIVGLNGIVTSQSGESLVLE